MKLNKQRLERLFQSIERISTLFLAQDVDKDILSDTDKQNLRKAGLDPKEIRSKQYLNKAYQFGIIAEALGDKRAKQMNFDQFNEFIGSGNFIPLTFEEEQAVNFLKQRAYSDIKGLGNRYFEKLNRVLIEVDKNKRKHLEKLIQETTISAVENRKSVKELAADLREITQDWKRDFERMAGYLMHEAYSHGKVAGMLRKGKASEIQVYYSVKPGACEVCQRLLLKDGLGSTPKLFPLSEIIANGSNIGRKAKDYKPVIGPIHVRCRCELMMKRKDYWWNPKTQSFSTPSRKVRNVLKERGAKIKVKVSYS